MSEENENKTWMILALVEATVIAVLLSVLGNNLEKPCREINPENNIKTEIIK